MNKNSFFKKLILLTFGAVFALQLQVAHGQDDTESSTQSTGGEECVIHEDEA